MRSLTALLVAITVATTAGQGTAQFGTCVTNLTPCFDYLKGTTTPPASCCNLLKDAVTNHKECLCNLYKNPSVLQGYGVNVSQAQNLPTRCNIPTHTSPADFCKDLVMVVEWCLGIDDEGVKGKYTVKIDRMRRVSECYQGRLKVNGGPVQHQKYEAPNMTILPPYHSNGLH